MSPNRYVTMIRRRERRCAGRRDGCPRRRVVPRSPWLRADRSHPPAERAAV